MSAVLQDYRLISGYQGITSYTYRKIDLPEDKLPLQTQTSGPILRIDNVNSETEGKYACTVTARNISTIGDIRVVFQTQLVQFIAEVSSVMFGFIDFRVCSLTNQSRQNIPTGPCIMYYLSAEGRSW